jgi:hypothetical protein
MKTKISTYGFRLHELHKLIASTRLFFCETEPGFIRNGFEHASPTGSRSQLQVISFHLIPSPRSNI